MSPRAQKDQHFGVRVQHVDHGKTLVKTAFLIRGPWRLVQAEPVPEHCQSSILETTSFFSSEMARQMQEAEYVHHLLENQVLWIRMGGLAPAVAEGNHKHGVVDGASEHGVFWEECSRGKHSLRPQHLLQVRRSDEHHWRVLSAPHHRVQRLQIIVLRHRGLRKNTLLNRHLAQSRGSKYVWLVSTCVSILCGHVCVPKKK